MSEKRYDILIKLLLIGDSGVGKSCLLLRFCQDEFTPSFINTIGIDFKLRNLEIDGKLAKVQIWDTAGQERFKTITTAYYRTAMGFMLVYDVTDPNSFENVRNWYNNIKENARENVQIVLVGNKNDIPDKRQVTYEQGQALGQELGVPFLETSAKTADSVEEAFTTLARLVKDNVDTESAAEAQQHVNVKDSSSGTSSCC